MSELRAHSPFHFTTMSKVKAEEVAPWLLLAAGGFVMYKFGDKLFGKSDTKKQGEETAKTVYTEITKKEKEGMKPNYSDTQYRTWADALVSAMFDVGTDEDAIYNVMYKLKNDLDILKLIGFFGIRPYHTFGIKQGDFNLGQWLREEMSTTERAKVNSILKANKVNYSFA